MTGNDGEVFQFAVGAVWERHSSDGSVLPETQRHQLRAATAQPEVFHSALVAGTGVGRRVNPESASSRKTLPSWRERNDEEQDGLAHFATIQNPSDFLYSYSARWALAQ